MGWVKQHDERPDHPKLVEAGPLAAHLDDVAILWCNRNLTDGVVPHRQVPRLVNWEGVMVRNGSPRPKPVDPMQLAQTLVEVGRWEEHPNGFYVHDYLEVQRSAKQIQDGRARDAARKSGGKS